MTADIDAVALVVVRPRNATEGITCLEHNDVLAALTEQLQSRCEPAPNWSVHVVGSMPHSWYCEQAGMAAARWRVKTCSIEWLEQCGVHGMPAMSASWATLRAREMPPM